MIQAVLFDLDDTLYPERDYFTGAFGEGGRIPPVVAAWLTNTIFAGVGLVLLVRAR